LGELALRVM